jgi:4-cresol dehydrogenase (hydroxylating) flavoprotein subunit
MSTVWTRPVPPGITAAELDDALEALTAELGPDKVVLGEAELREFRDPFQHASSEEYTASAVVMPTTLEEIQGSCASRTSAACRCGRTGRGATTATAARPRASGAA